MLPSGSVHMAVELAPSSGMGNAANADGFLSGRSTKSEMTIPLTSVNLFQELRDNRILPPGLYPATVNPHEEAEIKVPDNFSSVRGVARAVSGIVLPGGIRPTCGKIRESIDYYAKFDGFSSALDHSSRLRMGFVDGKLDSLRYLFAIDSGAEGVVSWSDIVSARVENVLIVMRNFKDADNIRKDRLDKATIGQFFAEHCAITHIVYKESSDISFGPQFEREYMDARIINEVGDSVNVTLQNGINSVDYFLKGVISNTTRMAFVQPRPFVEGLSTSLSLKKGIMTPRKLLGGYYYATLPDELGVEIEVKGDDSYRSLAADAVLQIAGALCSDTFGAMPHKASL